MNGLAKIIEKELKEQDKLTRHAIAEASENVLEHGENSTIIDERDAYIIAMNTRVV